MTLDQVVQRVRDTCPAFRLVAGAAQFSALTAVPTATPAAYVVPLKEVAGPDEGMDATVQRVEHRFGVYLCLLDVRSPSAAAGIADLAAVRADLLAALLGWQADAALLPVSFVGGELAQVQAGVLWWQDVFSTAYLIESL